MNNMDFQAFKEIYGGKSLIEKIELLIKTMEIWSDDRLAYQRAGNREDQDYYKNEIKAMEKRIDWLYEELVTGLQ